MAEKSVSERRTAGYSICPCIVFVDPMTSLVDTATGTEVVKDSELLANQGQVVTGVTADSAARVVVRIYTNAVGETVKVRLVGDGGSNIKHLPDEIGQLKSILPEDGDVAGQEVMLVSKGTTRGAMAFLQYFPPGDFSRNRDDDAARNRYVILNVASLTTGREYSAQLTIERPPVVLVHGLWGEVGNWSDFTGLTSDGRFTTAAANYGYSMAGRIIATEPNYVSNLILAPPAASSLGFEFNVKQVLAKIKATIASYRTSRIAVAQADVVAHSMGGLVTRTLENHPDYTGIDTFKIGYVHKLITIGTPHRGSPLADELLLESNNCVRGLLAVGGSLTIHHANIGGTWFSGGVYDLRTAMERDSALEKIQRANGHEVPTAFIVGVATDHNLNSLTCTGCWAEMVRRGCSGDPVATKLTTTGWSTLFGGNSDAIVSEPSQRNNAVAAKTVHGVIHSGGLTSLSFTGPHELNESSIPGAVIDLLNEPVFTNLFYRLP